MKYGIANVKAKIGGSGGADLNLAYGLTPPNDTSKIWVKCSEPSKVKIEANRNLVVSSDENAKLVETESILQTYLASTQVVNNDKIPLGTNMVKFANGTIFFLAGTLSSSSSKVLGQSGLITMYKDGEITAFESTSSGTKGLAIEKINDTRCVVLYKSASSTLNIKIYDNTGVQKSSWTKSGFTSVAGNILLFDKQNLLFYVFYNSSGDKVKKISVETSSADIITTNLTLPSDLTFSDVYANNAVLYNGYFYFLKGTTLWRGETTNFTFEKVKTGLPLNINGYNVQKSVNLIYGNKMIITDIVATTGNYANFILLIDLDTFDYEKIDLDFSYYNAFVNVDDNTGNIEIWGGYPTGATGHGYKKSIIYNVYTLEENTLDLYYDTSSSLNIKLIDTETLTMDAPINHAWLGDSNDIAQPVDFFYYKNSLWWGVNCLGYTQLKNCIISASDVAIDLANATSDTQTITITPTWANETGVITTSVATSDDTLATASLSGDSLVVNALAVGTPTITISVVDEYGTTYTKSITITITNSGA